jgi:hypothetical protein
VEIPDADRYPADDLRRADEAEANPEHADQSTVLDQAFNAEIPGFLGDETR